MVDVEVEVESASQAEELDEMDVLQSVRWESSSDAELLLERVVQEQLQQLQSAGHAHAAARVMSCGMTLTYFRSDPAMYKAGLAQEPAVAHLRWVLGSAGHTLGRRM